MPGTLEGTLDVEDKRHGIFLRPQTIREVQKSEQYRPQSAHPTKTCLIKITSAPELHHRTGAL